MKCTDILYGAVKNIKYTFTIVLHTTATSTTSLTLAILLLKFVIYEWMAVKELLLVQNYTNKHLGKHTTHYKTSGSYVAQ